MQTSRLTRPCAGPAAAVPVARLVLTTAGSSCGVMPDRDGQREQQRVDQRPVQQQVGDEDQRRSAPSATCSSSTEKRSQPELELGLRLALAQAQRRSGRTRRGRRWRPPRRSPLPDWTTVPMKAQDGQVGQGGPGGHRRRVLRRPAATRRSGCSRRTAGPSPSSSRRSAGTIAPSASCTTSPGHQVGDVDLVPAAPVAEHDGAVGDPRVQRLGGPLGAVLVDEAQADADQQDHADDDRVRCARRGTSESPAVMSSRIRMGLRNCRPRTAQPLAWWVRTAFGPSVGQAAGGFLVGQAAPGRSPAAPAPRPAGQARGVGDGQLEGGAAPGH